MIIISPLNYCFSDQIVSTNMVSTITLLFRHKQDLFMTYYPRTPNYLKRSFAGYKKGAIEMKVIVIT